MNAPLIELEQINKTFMMGKEPILALRNISLTIQENEFISVIGPSGSGKSTLMNVLGLLDQPDSGVYRLDGVPVQSVPDDERAKLRNQKIGFVFQVFNLLPRADALRNVEMPLVYSASYDRSFSKTKIRELAEGALRRVSLLDRMSHKPNELSGGQRQRVAIARAIVNRPRILLADEPTGNLDSKTGSEILALFEELHHEGVTVIMVTHDPKIAARARRTISMADGLIAKDEYAHS
ncbi:MAG: macrolide ABC transporter ATP-binding protein [Bdellovibrionales bacterium GWB1_52_6]|nr:MAG: macrolide ABC transporter ATP-binding protein [Bdellovibrionales bacterium GWB1_52_6]OFZ03621.1 MAG: macrolide ABC transporter ATP-binding protein [Bdellovibrionales bacterium GWA1_52_35]HCM40655.1 macrolide ABC transporter ATP-binding protein [Bdellovibrionales bacterium]